MTNVTRQADPKVKGNLHIRARNESERKIIGDLKQLANQDSVELTDLVMEGIIHMFKAHNWPPGNPQLQLTVFQKEKPLLENVCACGRPVELFYRLWQDKTLRKSCKLCFNTIPNHKIESWGPTKKHNKTHIT